MSDVSYTASFQWSSKHVQQDCIESLHYIAALKKYSLIRVLLIDPNTRTFDDSLLCLGQKLGIFDLKMWTIFGRSHRSSGAQ